MAQFELSIDNPKCEELALEWQSTAIAELDRILKANGIEESIGRKKILEEFFFNLAAQLDGSCLGIEFRPRLVFESTDTPPKILLSDKYDLHDNTLWDIEAVIEQSTDK